MVNTQTKKKKRLRLIENQIQDEGEPIEFEELVAQMIYDWGTTRRRARSYLSTLENTPKTDVVSFKIDGLKYYGTESVAEEFEEEGSEVDK